MTGVSANGSMILVAPSRFLETWSASALGVRVTAGASLRAACCSGAGVTCFLFVFSTGAVAGTDFLDFLVAGLAGSALPSTWSICSLSPDKRADRLLLWVAGCSGCGTASDFFLRAGGSGFAGSSGTGSGTGSALVVRLDVRRVNTKPSSSSSYAAVWSVHLIFRLGLQNATRARRRPSPDPAWQLHRQARLTCLCGFPRRAICFLCRAICVRFRSFYSGRIIIFESGARTPPSRSRAVCGHVKRL